MSSPFIPISSPPSATDGSTLELKSPLTTNMLHPSAPPLQMYLNTNENNVPLNLPAQPEPEQTTKSMPPGAQPSLRNNERKSSLATVPKNLDSILEESEHDSSTCLKSSIVSSPTSSFEDAEEESDDEDFDSDCSVDSEFENENAIDYQANLAQFQDATDSMIETEQELIFDRILCLVKSTTNDTTGPDFEKNQELLKIAETLHMLEDQLISVDAIIKKKDKLMEEATKSSMELHQVKQQFQDQMYQLQTEYSLIKQNFVKAQRSAQLNATRQKDARYVNVYFFSIFSVFLKQFYNP